MGKGLVVENVGLGKYRIQSTKEGSILTAENERIAELETLIVAKRQEIADAQAGGVNQAIIASMQNELLLLRIELIQREKKVERLEEAAKEAWCADYSLDLSGEIGTIEVNGETSQTLVMPGGEVPDNALVEPESQSPSTVAWNYAIFPGWQRWQPTYRIGTITSLSHSANTADVTLDAATSSFAGLNINPTNLNLSDVTVDYMRCNSRAFAVGDKVVVNFVGQSWDSPVIVGFESDPKPCSRVLYVSGYNLHGCLGQNKTYHRYTTGGGVAGAWANPEFLPSERTIPDDEWAYCFFESWTTTGEGGVGPSFSARWSQEFEYFWARKEANPYLKYEERVYEWETESAIGKRWVYNEYKTSTVPTVTHIDWDYFFEMLPVDFTDIAWISHNRVLGVTYILDESGKFFACGGNRWGTLGTGAEMGLDEYGVPMHQTTFSQVPGTWKQVKVGPERGMALKEDGTLWMTDSAVNPGNGYFHQVGSETWDSLSPSTDSVLKEVGNRVYEEYSVNYDDEVEYEDTIDLDELLGPILGTDFTLEEYRRFTEGIAGSISTVGESGLSLAEKYVNYFFGEQPALEEGCLYNLTYDYDEETVFWTKMNDDNDWIFCAGARELTTGEEPQYFASIDDGVLIAVKAT